MSITREALYRLGQVLKPARGERLPSVHAEAAIRLLVLTGRRGNEILAFDGTIWILKRARCALWRGSRAPWTRRRRVGA